MRKIQNILTVGDTKSIHSIGARSIPKVQRSSYLEIYVLRREKDRLEKEIYILDKRKNNADKRLDNVNRRIEKLQKEIDQEQKIKIHRDVLTKPLKTMGINY